MKATTLTLITLFLCLVTGLNAGTPEEILKQDVQEALDLLYEGTAGENLEARENKVRAILERRFSFQAISQRSLGAGWKQLDTEQQKRFREQFTQLLIRSYTSRFIGVSKPELIYGQSVDMGRNRLEIPVDVKLDGNRYKIAYRMADMDGEPMVYDIIIENVSLISNYRQQFSDLLNRKGMDAVFAALTEKLETSDAK